MNKIATIAAVVFIGFLYLAGALTAASFNISNWHQDIRTGTAVCMGVVACVWFIFIMGYNAEKKVRDKSDD